MADEEECQDTGKIMFEKHALSMCQHLKPLYSKAHMDDRFVNRVLVDNGSVVNILPTSILRKLFKTESDLNQQMFLLVALLEEPQKQNKSFLSKLKLAEK